MRFALCLLLLCSGLAGAHEVRHTVAPGAAVVVTLSYADGKPLAYEKYELTPEGAPAPLQVGHSDADGRIVFVPGAATSWRLKAYTADGHGVDLRLTVPATGTPPSREAAAAATAGPGRASLFALGLGLLLAAFGLLQMFVRRKR